MLRILILAFLLPAPLCSAQILIQPVPHAVSYMMLAGQLPRAIISPMTPDEQTKFKQVYDAVLAGNATLDAEGDAISALVNTYRTTLMAAMVKIDPKIEPLLKTPSNVTDAQSAEIIKAQSTAMQADPTLQSQWDDLQKKMTAHRQAVDAAMIKSDPTVAPILAKFAS